MSAKVFILTCVLTAGNVVLAQSDAVTDAERHLAINDPDKFAWLLFERINHQVPGDPAGRVLWETWALADDVFADPDNAPVWAGAAAPQRSTSDFDTEPLQRKLRRLRLQKESPGLAPQFSLPHALNEANETRLNRDTFDFVVGNDLYNIEGQEAFFDNNQPIEFPLDAKEIKAQWRKIDDSDVAKFHTAKSTNADGSTQLWGLTSLHITTKDLPNWFWCTFEHKDNPGREAVIPDRDSHGLPQSLNGTKWANYVLRGSQTDFVTPIGQTTLLASSQIEAGFQDTSSCITCHARASIGSRPLGQSPPASRLSVFEASGGSVGIPEANWFIDTSTQPPTRRFLQTDFVWSLFRARGKSVTPSPGPAGAPLTSPRNVAIRREKIRQFAGKPAGGAELVQVQPLIRADAARPRFRVTGRGLTVAVFDTGLRTSHIDFAGRVVAQRNFTNDNGGDKTNASDGDGHGTNVTGIIASDGVHHGIAPEAKIVPIKVLPNSGSGSFTMVRDGLQWVLDNHSAHKITVVNMSLGDGGNYTSDNFVGDEIRALIQKLRAAQIPVVVSAGNDYFSHSSTQGMGYPGIFRETVSVGAVFDANEGGFTYGSGAACTSSDADQITPFSQRLHESSNAKLRTDIFAPGAPVTSSGIMDDRGESIQHGTSQAAPVTTGVILLMQQFCLRERGKLPTVDEVEEFLRRGAVKVHDDAGAADNVTNTNKTFLRIDAVGALEAVVNQIERDRFDGKL